MNFSRLSKGKNSFCRARHILVSVMLVTLKLNRITAAIFRLK
jgi:hypothetical protein